MLVGLYLNRYKGFSLSSARQKIPDSCLFVGFLFLFFFGFFVWVLGGDFVWSVLGWDFFVGFFQLFVCCCYCCFIFCSNSSSSTMLPCGFPDYLSVSFGARGTMVYLVLLESFVLLISVMQSVINLPAYSRSSFPFCLFCCPVDKRAL